jgi:hypothetical protein
MLQNSWLFILFGCLAFAEFMNAVQREGLLLYCSLSLFSVADFSAIFKPLGTLLAHKAVKQFVKHLSFLIEISDRLDHQLLCLGTY